MDTEILLIDEVLAVGDAAFQKKCLGKMGDVATKEGRTVLFVSHNMAAVEQLCKSCILIDRGSIIQYGSNVHDIIKEYLTEPSERIFSPQWININDEFNNPWFKPQKFFISDSSGHHLENPVTNNREIWIQIEGIVEHPDPALAIGYSIMNETGIVLYWSNFNDLAENLWPKISSGKLKLRTKIPKRFLNEGIYSIELMSSLRCRQWILEPGKKLPSLNLIIKGGLSDSPYWTEKRPGVIAPLMEWTGENI
jgi:lipopolysaccharide transport system ATP-binding protein